MNSQMVKLDAAALADAMLRRCMVRHELQERSGTSQFTTWKACNGQSISLQTAKRIAGALRVALRKLLADSEGAGGEQSSVVDPISEQTGVGGGASAA